MTVISWKPSIVDGVLYKHFLPLMPEFQRNGCFHGLRIDKWREYWKRDGNIQFYKLSTD